MISSYDIESMQSKLEDGEFIKICFGNESVLYVDEKDLILHHMIPFGEKEDVSSLLIEREDGRKLIVNLNRVDYVCTSKNKYKYL